MKWQIVSAKSRYAHLYKPSLRHPNMFIAACSVTSLHTESELLPADGSRRCSWCILKQNALIEQLDDVEQNAEV